ncbi:MAG: signal recognition particle receptor subunit alpha, partial [Firmicutes bacterium]|nr:signal recognition particle receptor subunit alpha [Bacillota bacterium]
MEKKKKGFFARLAEKIDDLILMRPYADEETIDELEEVLIASDIGMDTTLKITDELRERVRMDRLHYSDQLKPAIEEITKDLVDKGEALKLKDEYPLFIMMIGVNGVGKTTSIAKLAHRFKSQGKSVLLI